MARRFRSHRSRTVRSDESAHRVHLRAVYALAGTRLRTPGARSVSGGIHEAEQYGRLNAVQRGRQRLECVDLSPRFSQTEAIQEAPLMAIETCEHACGWC